MSFQITDYHDACFKSFFSQEEFVRDFIQYYIPEEIKNHLDLSSIEIDMEGYISEEFKGKSHGDRISALGSYSISSYALFTPPAKPFHPSTPEVTYAPHCEIYPRFEEYGLPC